MDREEWRGRLRNGRDFLQSASDLLALAGEESNSNPIMSQAISSAIAYADALTIKFAGLQNQQDHALAVRAVRFALGERAEARQMLHLQKLLARKDDAQYGHRVGSIHEAREVVEQARRFAEWAEAELARS